MNRFGSPPTADEIAEMAASGRDISGFYTNQGTMKQPETPVKQQITLRLNAAIVAWIKARAQGGRSYQSDINRALREHVERCEREVRA